jgi:valyl-tRNA synthetase
METLVRLLAPVLPFATEEVWSWTHEGSIHEASWPHPTDLPTPTSTDSAGLLALSSAALITIRRAKTDHQVAQKTGISSATLFGPALLEHAGADVKAVGKIESLSFVHGDTIELQDVVWETIDD